MAEIIAIFSIAAFLIFAAGCLLKLKRQFEHISIYCLRLQGALNDMEAERDFYKRNMMLTYENCLKLIEQNNQLKHEFSVVQVLYGHYHKWYNELSHKLRNPRNDKGRFCGVELVK
jgi:predicted HTH transcriptional regulator